MESDRMGRDEVGRAGSWKEMRNEVKRWDEVDEMI
jgi:hypothetical protein